MSILAALIFLGAIPAAVAAALGGLLSIHKQGWSLRRRTATAAAVAGFVPVVLPIAWVLTGHDGGIGPVIPVLALTILAALIALLVGAPVALSAGRRKQQPHPDRSAD